MDILSPTFYLPINSNGVSNLNPQITMNSVAVSPDYVLIGSQATSASWSTYNFGSETFTLTGSGTFPTSSYGSPLISSSLDNSLRFDLGTPKCFSASAGVIGNFGLNDFVVEGLFYNDGDSSIRDILHKGYSNNPADRKNWTIYLENGIVGMYFESNALTLNAPMSGGLASKTWGHVMFFGDRDANLEAYIDGYGPYIFDISSLIAEDFTNTNKLTLGGIDGWNTNIRAKGDAISYLASWQSNNWILNSPNGLLERQNLVKERFQRMTGLWPTIANGTKLLQNYFTSTGTENTTKFFDKYENGTKRIYKVNNNWPKVTTRLDNLNNIRTGLLVESSDTPLINNLYPSSVISASITLNSTYSPARTKDAVAITANAVTTIHGISQSSDFKSGFLYNNPTTVSCYVKAGNKNFVYIADNAISNTWAYYNITPAVGVVGSKGTNVKTTRIEKLTDDWYRCWFYHTSSVIYSNPRVFASTTDLGIANPTFLGDGATKNIYVWGLLVDTETHSPKNVKSNGNTLGTEVGRRFNSTYLFTASDGNIGGTGNNKQGRMKCNILLPSDKSIYGNTAISIYKNDTGSVDYSQTLGSASFSVINNDTIQALLVNNSINTTDNLSHELFSIWDNIKTSVYVDNILQDFKSSYTAPDSLDFISLGKTIDFSWQESNANGLSSGYYALDGLIWGITLDGLGEVTEQISPSLVGPIGSDFSLNYYVDLPSQRADVFNAKVYISPFSLAHRTISLRGNQIVSSSI